MFRKPPSHNSITLPQLKELLQSNHGLIIVKFSATWCGPCQNILPQFNLLADMAIQSGATVLTVDIDECPDIYQFYKSKRMITGVPTIFAFYAGSKSVMPDHFVIGSLKSELATFFYEIMKNV